MVRKKHKEKSRCTPSFTSIFLASIFTFGGWFYFYHLQDDINLQTEDLFNVQDMQPSGQKFGSGKLRGHYVTDDENPDHVANTSVLDNLHSDGVAIHKLDGVTSLRTALGETVEKIESKKKVEESRYGLSKEMWSWTVICLFGCIVWLSVFFEVSQNALHNYLARKKESYLEIMEAMFRELTILGFVGLCLIVSIKSGLVHNISARLCQTIPALRSKVVNDIKKTNPAEQKYMSAMHLNVFTIADAITEEELVKVFEDVHMLIFYVMICFIGFVALLLTTAEYTQQKISRFDETRDPVVPTNIFKFWKKFDYVDALVYRLIRKEFFNPYDNNKRFPIRRPSCFSLPDYFGRCMVEMVVELIEIPPMSWMILLIVLTACRPLMKIEDEQIPHVLFSLSYTLFTLILLITYQVYSLYRGVLPPVAPSYFTPTELIQQYHGIDTKPRCFDVPLKRTDNLLRIFLSGTESPNQQEALFTLWANGPGALSTMTQVLLFLQAVFLAVYLTSGIELSWGQFTLMWLPWAFEFIVLWPRILFFFTIATSTNLMKRQHVIDASWTFTINGLYRKYGALLYEIHTHARIYKIKNFTDHEYKSWTTHKRENFRKVMHPEYVKALESAFNLWDADDSGFVDKKEMFACLKAQNCEEEKARRVIENWFQSKVFRDIVTPRGDKHDKPGRRRASIMDNLHDFAANNALGKPKVARVSAPELDQDQEIQLSKENFEILMVNLYELEQVDGDTKYIDTERWLHDSLDDDQSGTVSIDEFYDGLLNVCVYSGITRDSVHKLFCIIDGTSDEDANIDSLEIAKIIVWLREFAEAGKTDEEKDGEHQHHFGRGSALQTGKERPSFTQEELSEREKKDEEIQEELGRLTDQDSVGPTEYPPLYCDPDGTAVDKKIARKFSDEGRRQGLSMLAHKKNNKKSIDSSDSGIGTNQSVKSVKSGNGIAKDKPKIPKLAMNGQTK